MPTRVDLQPFLLGNVTRADADLAQPKICGGSNKSERSTVDSMGGGDEVDQPKKTFSERFFTSASKLWCVGGIFKTIAGWFNIHIEDTKEESGKEGVQGASKKTQAKSKETIKKVFENDEPTAKQIKKAKDAFRTLSLAGKLAVIRNLLNNENCKSKLVFSFIEMLGKSNVAGLKKCIAEEMEDEEDAGKALKKCQDEDNNAAVKAGVAAYLAKVQDKADGAKLKLIRKTFDGHADYPNAKARQAALDAFKTLESPVSQMVILIGLLDSPHIAMDHVAEFAVALPKGTVKKDDEDDDVEEVSKSKGKKGAKKKDEVEDDEDEDEDGEIESDNIQGRLLTLIKDVRKTQEDADKELYKAGQDLLKAWKKDHKGKKVPKEVLDEVPEKAAAFKNLRGYFKASAAKDGIREAVREQAQTLLKQLRDEQEAEDIA